MRLFIPTIGSQIRLLTDWTFTLHWEYRNYNFLKKCGFTREDNPRYGRYGWGAEPAGQVTLPSGTVLCVNRIYIRQGRKDFDSVTFSLKGSPDKKFKTGKFWVKLPEANEIECTIVKE